MKKRFSKFLMLIFFISFIGGCSCKNNNNLIVYRNYYEQDVTTFNYMITNEYNDIVRIANLVDGLVENDKYGNVVSSIAKSWDNKIIDGKQIWTFYLKDNVYWSDYNGNKYGLVTAHDFVTTLKYSLNYNTKSNNYNLANNLLENAKNYYNGTLIKHFDHEEILAKIKQLEKSDPNYELHYYKNIKAVFDYCDSNQCIDNFENVGIKAINDFELQFTLIKPVPYFLSALTYCSFLPVNETFIKEIGFNNFGTSRKTLLYNGAYLLSSYSHSNRIEYSKNPNYWDVDNVFIDKLIFTKALNYQSISYSRLSYENGNISEFNLNKYDYTGWQKYVEGPEGLGTETNPFGNNTYVNTENVNFLTYYFLLNQNRTNHTYSTLNEKESFLANKALSNTNFRKALFHGINRTYYYDSDVHTMISTIVPEGFIANNNKDYTQYFLEEFAEKSNISFEAAKDMFSNDPYYDLEKSQHYLNLAINELNISKDDLPIKLEYTYYYNEEYKTYDLDRINKWNKELNGCSVDTTECNFNKIMIVYNNEVDSINKYNQAFYNQEYNLTFIGLYPDFNDPTTYFNSFGSDGELLAYLNHNSLEIDNKLNQINSHYTKEDLDTRFNLCAELEHYILLNESLVIPLSLNGSNNQIIISDLVPFSKMKANYGLSPFKFKHKKIRNTTYTQADITKLKEEYEKGKLEQ